MVAFPHNPSRPVLEIDYRRALVFLQSAERIRECEQRSGDGRNFYIISRQWFRLAGLEYFHGKASAKIVESVKRGLEYVALALELGFEIQTTQALHDVLAALAVADAASAHFLVSSPPKSLGFENDPAD